MKSDQAGGECGQPHVCDAPIPNIYTAIQNKYFYLRYQDHISPAPWLMTYTRPVGSRQRNAA